MKRLWIYAFLLLLFYGCGSGTVSPQASTTQKQEATTAIPTTQSETKPVTTVPKTIEDEHEPDAEEMFFKVDALFGDYIIVAYLYPNTDYSETFVFHESAIYPPDLFGTRISLSENSVSIGDAVFNDAKYKPYVYNTYYDHLPNLMWPLAGSLDLSPEMQKMWGTWDEYHVNIHSPEFPELASERYWRSDIGHALCFNTVLDENHLVIGEYLWNMLAVRESHLLEGCNYLGLWETIGDVVLME